MKIIETNEQKNIQGGRVRCSACKKSWRNRWWYLLTAGAHNLAHILEGKWFTVE